MKEAQRKAIIPELDYLVTKAETLRKEFDDMIFSYKLAEEGTIIPASSVAHQLVASLKKASDTLKQAGAEGIQEYVTDWAFSRDEDTGEDAEEPVYEHIKYTGDNTWEIIMTTETHGKERVVVHSDTSTWTQVYSVDPA